ncbi:MAG: ester cyclase [Chloroflexi bacterium]|nr:ester cyclase [Chloroflexota bacterium]OJW06527.1 MAG: hypothetical protein BGO39_00500 [Chloroflexi bacterium 54-19]
MDAEKNIALAYNWFTHGWLGDHDLADQLFPPTFTINGQPVGPDGPKSNNRNRLAGFPDLSVEVADQFAFEDKVVTRLVWRGTHTGEYSGIPATGKRVEALTLNIFRFEGEKVVESWSVTDQFGILRQLGQLPTGIQSAQVALEHH